MISLEQKRSFVCGKGLHFGGTMNGAFVAGERNGVLPLLAGYTIGLELPRLSAVVSSSIYFPSRV